MKTKQKLILTAIATTTLLSTQTVSNKVAFAAEETPTVISEATTDPGTGGNTGGTTDPGTGGNTGGTTTDPGTDGNIGGTTDPIDPITEGNTTSPNIGNGVVVPNTQKPINSNVSEQAGIPTSNNEQQNLNTSEGSEPVDQTSLLPKTGGEKTNAFELSLLTSVTSVIFTTILRLKMKKGGDVQ